MIGNPWCIERKKTSIKTRKKKGAGDDFDKAPGIREAVSGVKGSMVLR